MQIKLTTIDEIKDFVSKANTYKYNMDIQSGKYRVDAKSIMGVFSLDLNHPVELVIDRPECADEFLDSISTYIVEPVRG